MMAVRLIDVARLAGVSAATVSRVVAGYPHVRPELRERVQSAVEELGYRPSRVARSLRGRNAQIIGVIISDIQNPFFTQLVRAVEDVAYERDYAIFLCNTDEDSVKERLYIDLMVAEQVAGVVICPATEETSVCRPLADAQIAVVTVDRLIEGECLDAVLVDNVGASFALVEHLIADGHRRIAAIVPNQLTTTGRQRCEGYHRAMEKHGLQSGRVSACHGKPSDLSGYEYTQRLLNDYNRPTALFTGNNMLTLGALRAIRDAGLRIPDDIALVAFDDLDWMSLTQPQLTVVSQPTYELGRTAAERLFARIQDRTQPCEQIVLEPEIMIRQSCAHHDRPVTVQLPSWPTAQLHPTPITPSS